MKNKYDPLSKSLKIKSTAIKDIALNLSFKEMLIRFAILFLLPIMALFIDKGLVIYTVPISMYLLTTALIQFCIIKFFWHQYIHYESPTLHHTYGQDPNYPDESIG